MDNGKLLIARAPGLAKVGRSDVRLPSSKGLIPAGA